ncbi:MAG: T9SS type A sorting domain-containing protein [Bacteroidetes bacterium]|nr:T9SS type A sorting domain-containing protein [Bacteroidota bacterium]
MILTKDGNSINGILKTNANGDSLWSKSFYTHRIRLVYFQQTADSGFIFCGNFGDPDSIPFPLFTSNIYLLKTNKYGDSLWSIIYDLSPFTEAANFISETSDGGYILTGVYNYEDYTGSDILFMKTNSTGDSLWTKIYGNPGQVWDEGVWINETPDGEYLAWVSNPACSLMKLNSSGDTLWSKVVINNYKAYSYSKCSDNGFIMLSGIWYSSENSDIRVIKTDSVGTIQWDKLYGCAGYDDAHNVTQTFDGGFMVLARNISSCYPGTVVYLMKLNSLGDTLWSKTFPSIYYPTSFQQTQDSGFVLTGIYYKGTDNDILLIKTDSAGNSPASINEIFEKEQTLFYPNPFNKTAKLKIITSKNYSNIKFNVFSSLGIKVGITFSITENEITVERNDLPCGMYFYQLLDNGKILRQGKFIIE